MFPREEDLVSSRTTWLRNIALAALVVSTTSGMAALPATATNTEASTETISLAMTVGGFDAAVAAANGYAIVTSADGIQYSVEQGNLQPAGTPALVDVVDAAGQSHSVDPAVLAVATSYDPDPEPTPASGPEISPFGFAQVPGDCGISYISLNRNPNNSVVSIRTGYDVRLPVEQRVWTVNLYGVYGVVIVPMNGGATAREWEGVRTRTYSAGGFGNVVPGSNVVLTDGATCWSGSPGTTF